MYTYVTEVSEVPCVWPCVWFFVHPSLWLAYYVPFCLCCYLSVHPSVHLSVFPSASNLVMPSQPDLPRTNPKLFCPPNNKRRHGPATAKVTPSEKTNATSLRKWIVPSMPQGQVSTLAELRTRSEKTHALIGIGIHLPLPKVVKFISGYFFDILTSK